MMLRIVVEAAGTVCDADCSIFYCEFIGRRNAQTDEHNCTADCGIEYDCSSRSRRLVAISSSSSAGVVLQLTSHKAALPADRQLSGMPAIRRFSREISAD